MKKSMHGIHGFSRRELIVSLGMAGMIGLMIFSSLQSGSRIIPGVRANAHAKTAKAIYNWLLTYAKDNNGKFPETSTFSNEAFRQMFIKKYLDDEGGFAIGGDAWLNHARGGNKKPDGNIGTEPDFAQAVAPGECSWAYVTGLNTESQPNLPILANAFTEIIGIYTADKSKKGGVLLGQKAVWVSVGGSAKVVDLRNTEHGPMVTEKMNGRDTSVFSTFWGTEPGNVKNPAP